MSVLEWIDLALALAVSGSVLAHSLSLTSMPPRGVGECGFRFR